MTEINMMKELRARGPITGDFEPTVSWHYYKRGVFSEDHQKDFKHMESNAEIGNKDLNVKTLKDYEM